ncbi:MAG: GspE/PulE family protein [Planctomycetota bacterium]
MEPAADTETTAIALRSERVSPGFLQRVSRDFARAHLLLSQGREGQIEILVVSETTDPAAVFNVGVQLGLEARAVLADGEAIARMIDEVYGEHAELLGTDTLEVDDEQVIERLLEGVDRDLLSTQGKGPLVQFVDSLLFEALGRGASDVHVQPLCDRTLVRVRVDGALHNVREIPSTLAKAIVSRIKVMGRMDIAERRIAQDGRATVTIGDRAVDLRISTFPTSYGERAVVRLLDNTRQLRDLESLGMPAELWHQFLGCARATKGIVLVTGPTGSGKTTTLYATLQQISSSELNLMTIEDPIEYELSTLGLTISQAQVNAKKGITFATGLRHILRQDPDVVLVGEIRDEETARMAIQSSLTGHLVFSTLHTNDATSAIHRLIDLGVEPYLLSSSLSAVLAQRLVRLTHDACEGRGCDTCFGTGLFGRTGIFELMTVDEEIRSLIARRGSLAEFRRAARAGGMTTLQEQGQRLVEAGKTSAAEIARIVEAEA